jgi:hypothetical protein
MRNFDLNSFFLGILIMSIPTAYLMGRRHSAMWEVASKIHSEIEQKQAEQINAIMRTAITEPEQIKKKGG